MASQEVDQIAPVDLEPEGPLLDRPRDVHDKNCSFSWLSALGFSFLTLNSGMAIYRSWGDVGATTFVTFSYIGLVLLFCILRQFEKAPAGSPQRDRLKPFVCVLTIMLALLFGSVDRGTGPAELSLPLEL